MARLAEMSGRPELVGRLAGELARGELLRRLGWLSGGLS
jgi:hypothetical protein